MERAASNYKEGEATSFETEAKYVVHRHADPITTSRPAESVVQK
jgi:hypothetical protein